MRRSIALLALIIFLSAFPTQAQESIRIASLRVDVWPEFDRPAVLVIYHITLAADTSLPAVLNLRVPKQAVVNAVAVEDPSLGLLITDYTRTNAGDWATLSITATTLMVQVEYYDVLVKVGTSRQVVYEWLGDAAVDAFSVVFQNPVGAVNLILDPSPGSSQRDQYDLLNYVTDTISLEEGETFTLQASYEKADDELSVASLPVEPIIPLDETSGQVAWGDLLPWILGGLGLILIVFGLFVLFGFRGRARWRVSKSTKGGAARHSSRSAKTAKELAPIYCNECGRRAEPSDQFCRSCGTRLRREG